MATEVVIPVLGLTVEKGTILKWLKKEGDRVEKGEPLFEVEADKVTTQVEAPATGILKKILVPEGIEVPILTVVAIITDEGEELPEKYRTSAEAFQAPSVSAGEERRVTEVARAEERKEVRAVPAARRLAKEKGIDLNLVKGTGPNGLILVKDVEQAVAEAETRPRASSVAKRLAEREGISLEAIKGTGPRGRVMKADVVAALKAREETPTAEEPFGKVIPMSTMRKVIAKRMSESAFTAPHIYFFTDVVIDKLLELRKTILEDFEKEFGLRPSVNDFIIKAVALTIRDFPFFNASLVGEEIHIHPEINIGLAVALPDGLIVPAIPKADKLGIGEIAKMRKDLVERARSGKLKIEEIERGTFTVSSLAQYDITFFTAILNPPQSGILTIGKTRTELALQDGVIHTYNVATFGLSVDHRIIDGAMAADFLQTLKRKLENPVLAFLHL